MAHRPRAAPRRSCLVVRVNTQNRGLRVPRPLGSSHRSASPTSRRSDTQSGSTSDSTGGTAERRMSRYTRVPVREPRRDSAPWSVRERRQSGGAEWIACGAGADGAMTTAAWRSGNAAESGAARWVRAPGMRASAALASRQHCDVYTGPMMPMFTSVRSVPRRAQGHRRGRCRGEARATRGCSRSVTSITARSAERSESATSRSGSGSIAR